MPKGQVTFVMRGASLLPGRTLPSPLRKARRRLLSTKRHALLANGQSRGLRKGGLDSWNGREMRGQDVDRVKGQERQRKGSEGRGSRAREKGGETQQRRRGAQGTEARDGHRKRERGREEKRIEGGKWNGRAVRGSRGEKGSEDRKKETCTHACPQAPGEKRGEDNVPDKMVREARGKEGLGQV
eukprot:366372-Pleurochrysis_carterae.AAC.2